VTLGARIADGDFAMDGEQRPIRGELFGATRLAGHARALARTHEVAPTRGQGWFARRARGPLLSRLDATEAALIAARDAVAEASASGTDVSAAGAWLLDNFFIVHDQVLEIRATLPARYYQELPKLLGHGALAGHPRIYEIVIEMIAHTDGRLDEPTVALMVREYQRVTPLTMGELWAIPAMLRLGYLENVRRMALRTARDLADRELADEWVTRLLSADSGDEPEVDLSEFVHGGPPLTPAFLTRFVQQIRSRRTDFTPLLWLEQWVAEDVVSVEEAAQHSAQELALTQLVMANSIASLRAVPSIDWTAFVERASATEAVLRGDPSGTYAGMTRSTRDHYRHAVERIARGSGQAEPAVAAAAVEAARATRSEGAEGDRQSHVGYYLLDEGRRAFERAIGYRGPASSRWREWLLDHPGAYYFGALATLTVVALALLTRPLHASPLAVTSAALVVAALLFALLPAVDAAVAIVNQLVTILVPPRRLPRLDYERAVPERDRTAVVVPLLVGSVEAMEHALEHIEVQYLANRDPQIRFAILSDLFDASAETVAADAGIVEAGVAGVRALNALYAAESEIGEHPDAPFYLLHRPRRWNTADAVWMGWERKRGKLADFNAFISGTADDVFSVAEGDLPWLRGVRYVITLDGDTVLPRGAAAALIGTMAHPLNRAEFDPADGRVLRGYGILQPRVSVSLASASESRFAAVYSGHPGVDPYTTAVSDVYQDLFGEGTFTGKGIYDVDVFQRATAGRFPDNALLSHDLIEGAFARAGLVTDVEVFDDYPTRYLTSTRRTHRWIRGDWQLLPWLAAKVPGTGGPHLTPLSGLSRWKIADNMRRSLTPIALLAWLMAGWTILPGSGLAWTTAVFAALSMPWVIPALFAAARPPRGQGWRPYYAALGHDVSRAAAQFGLAVVLLPDQVLLAIDAVVRSLTRVLFTQRHMLEWQTASHIERTTGYSRVSVWKRMWSAVLLGAAVMAMVVSYAIGHPMGNAPLWLQSGALATLTFAWLLAPEMAVALSAPLRRRYLVLTAAQRATTLQYALRHWRYFDRFVSADTHWLVPDNFQVTPEPVVATRTSPTNIGLQLLSTMSACDLGFLTRGEMLDRLELAFDSLDRMPTLQGHFYNWYDLQELRVLEPPYVSTVDSGNLAGHLVALAQGCLGMIDGPVDDARLWAVLDAEAVQHDERASPSDVRGNAPWVGERLIDYQTATLDIRRRAALATATREHTATMLWARQRLDAAAAELSQFGLDADDEAGMPLRLAARRSDGAAAMTKRLEVLASRARTMAMAMDFRLVYEPQRRLFSIGYDARAGTLDESSYDLLASEARLASFIAVAKGDAPTEHWFRLGRSLTVTDGAPALVSWSGSMFEYLMPLLVMPPRPFSLLDQTCHSAVHRHIGYARARGVPWGISESAYNLRDRHDTYQYRAFGVPDLALKRGLASDLVIAPYASALAAAVDADAALGNLAELERSGALGGYGFYDAVDYTRVGPEGNAALVQTFMAHHVGMSLVALTNAMSIREGVSESTWQQRFMADPAVRAAALLLDERVPRRYVARATQSDEPERIVEVTAHTQTFLYEVDTPHTDEPRVALLGGAGYSVLLTNAGSGRSRADAVDVLRWRADATRDDTGHWIYIKDLTAGTKWSAGYQPIRATPLSYRATFATDRVTFSRRDGAIDTRTEIVVIASEQAEVRRVTLVNRSSQTREVELTSYGEIVLCPPAADRAHPAFQKLFVETEWVADATLIASRRPRSSEEVWPWCAHVVAAGPERVGEIGYETDRSRFLGRGRTVHEPRALDAGAELSGTVGAVLDPIVALRVRVRIEPGRSASVAFTTAVADSREAALQLADRYRDVAAAERALSLSRTEAEIELRNLDIAPADVALYQQLAGALIYPREALRVPESERAAMTQGQSALWTQGISGDWPIVLATVRTPAGLASVRKLLVAHRYWRSKGIRTDLVILNAKPHSYAQELQDQLVTLSMASSEGGVLERPGGVFIRRADVLSADDTALLRATARVHVLCDGVGLGEIVAANTLSHPSRAQVPARVVPSSSIRGDVTDRAGIDAPATERPNGFGDVNDAGDYEIDVSGDRVPPGPWANVIANPAVGFCVTERGGGFTWAENSYFFRLTPWFNDPVSDPSGEVLYLHDLDSGAIWTPTPGPTAATGAPNASPAYTVTHAPGLSRFTHARDGIATELTLGVPRADAVKISRLRITNHGATERRLSLTSYVEWVLGAQREETRHQLHTSRDPASGAILARNHYAPDFGDRVAFSWISEESSSYTARRDHFIGRNNDLVSPAAMREEQLSGATGSGVEPCAALRCLLTLEPGASREVVILLGAASSEDLARELIDRHGAPANAESSLIESTTMWEQRLSTIAVTTPDAEFDVLLNRWSLYQALACRMWARSALYQSSGAYGFRDQLQDCMAFVYAEPEVARAHILRAASRQFVEGDVQHWWHEPSGRGTRTRFSDDLAWLPFVADRYVRVTGDTGIWDALANYLSMRPLAPGEHEVYEQPRRSDESGTLYEHCVRALDKACTQGEHGLPLIGVGDWNDGMNRVGVEGKGESVWLAWFLAATLRQFAVHAETRGDQVVVERFRTRARDYAAAVERTSWDGAWYRRAYFDDGSALGTAADDECMIDSLSQSWAVISGVADTARARTAMRSVNEHLVREDLRILLLLTPPFDHSERDPGYIKGYVPGVRENGAQYTHAALWMVLATTQLGDGDRAGELMRMLNPLSHARSRADAETYTVEPYVVAADVYAVRGHEGRGGWTWYTGSASWSYRVALEAILGFDKRGATLRMSPCIPRDWPGYTIEYRYGSSSYVIDVRNPHGASTGVISTTVDGVMATDGVVALLDDQQRHTVVVVLGEA